MKSTITPEEFRSWREGSGLSLTKAAEALGVSRSAVCKYQAGARPIPETVARLMRA